MNQKKVNKKPKTKLRKGNQKQFQEKKEKKTYWQLGVQLLSRFLPVNSKFEFPTPYKKGGREVQIWVKEQQNTEQQQSTEEQ